VNYDPNNPLGVRWNPIYSGEVYFDDQVSPQSQVGGYYVGDVAPNVQGANMGANGGSDVSPSMMNEMDARPMAQKPAFSFLFLTILLVIFIFVSRKFGGPEKFGNIKLTLWNGLFAVVFIIIIMGFLKAVAPWLMKVPFLRGVGELFLAI